MRRAAAASGAVSWPAVLLVVLAALVVANYLGGHYGAVFATSVGAFLVAAFAVLTEW